jgi:hypothetical protein
MTEEKSIFQKIGDAIADYAPGVATVLAATGVGVPAAAAIGAVGALGRAFGLGTNAKPEDILAAISADPEIKLKAMIANNDFLLKQRGQDIDELKTLLGDVQSARTRQVESEKATGKRDYNLYILAWTMVVGFFALLAYLMGHPIPPDQNGVIFMLFGSLSTAFGCVIQYFFGSSKSSADKNEQIGQLRKQIR